MHLDFCTIRCPQSGVSGIVKGSDLGLNSVSFGRASRTAQRGEHREERQPCSVTVPPVWLLDDHAALIPLHHELQKSQGLGTI